MLFSWPSVLGSAAFLAHAASSEAQAQSPLSSDYTCAHPPYAVHIVSKSPFVMYLEGFLTSDERLHLLQLAHGQFSHSAVLDANGESSIHSARTSQSTPVERSPIVRCIEERALNFQGFDVPSSHLEPIQLVKYVPTEHYHFHTDWFTDDSYTTATNGGNRATSFFGYVQAENVTGGGTNFPMLEPPADEEWCRFIDCDEEYDKGVTFRPVEGNAVYWENMVDGKGDPRVLHAGLPVVGGEKVGMNIWTRQGPLPDEIRGHY
ncbi:Prolyl 4-hydroxylase, alpha subunit [Moelleriella libera RCEF 2490]|uniref:Prolyl 4-hydroxylase, alpha subunit n=1 Tax=Moelleriella libera RCEF 2490 TaxID=1081109 RepID=A0A166V398_9HYPO|nr:Prolyl 4-hydroxylase, alpha subunit [Moelleriella libera RCEF 2490]